ncbi:rhomboid family intramembrane serine protease [Tenacibaculum maritimum]|uniref:rhomboid family intramembrane serine protease n=1 Tax=Tenacibaculum maritimum TaxID=107401 RepID=UPI00230800F0|nr:rhomboid family intramembrane serine protease [Tenacibaculum maritimum]MDB0600247.1 rhomboid family intramembrane serine protease [Tenacibaculum maritimum]MDB0610758.1 rhomboid family intramembrane serine protease [Tenacibaculum maritimum]
MSRIVLVVIIATVLVSLKGFNDRFFFDRYKFQISEILNGDKLRMFSSGFLHADYIHLFFNMYALYLFGDIVANSLGSINFMIVYIGSLLGGSMYSLYRHKRTPYYSAIGASGAVSGIVYAAIMLYPGMELMMFPIPIPMPGYIFGIGYLLYSIYGMKKQLGNVGHAAHLGGAIGGFIITLLLFPAVFSENKMFIAFLAVPIIGLLAFGDRLQKM